MDENTTNTTEVEETTAAEPETKFTQADVDRIVSERLNRERKNQPSETELKEFREWKKTNKTEAEQKEELQRNYDRAVKELNTLKAQAKVVNAQCKAEFAEFVTAQIMSIEGDIDKNIADYKKTHPQYFADTPSAKVATAAVMTSGANPVSTNEKMNSFLRRRR